MGESFFENKEFKHVNYSGSPLPKGDYELCIFNNCDFLNADLMEIKFIDCEFNDCNFSGANISNTAFQSVKFEGCKMLGLHFEYANPFGMSFSFSHCQLNHSSFYKLKLPRITINFCNLEGVDFTEATLIGADFGASDFKMARFDRTNVEKSDFRGATNYQIDVENNRIKGSKFNLDEVSGLLTKYNLKIEQ
ncbi:pentapeptide repeat-containing protein [Crocinitomix catalasitica]|uniref:pentapeptide repeat-containing protein n=1 Tax=Crocinitomix catalasitica TaxID=184607 RepID=UPI00048560DE|nr:pentapeptide repeat-containing protein [Crocinitomix catalasitica]